MTTEEEEKFDAEFARLIEENELCPVCHRSPVEVGSTRGEDDVEFILYAICETGHMYVVEPSEDDDGI